MIAKNFSTVSLNRSFRLRLFLCLGLSFLAGMETAHGQFKFRQPPNRQTPEALAPVDEQFLWEVFLQSRNIGNFQLGGKLVYRPPRGASVVFPFTMEGDWSASQRYTRFVLTLPDASVQVREIVQSQGTARFVSRDDEGNLCPGEVIHPSDRISESLPLSWNDLLMPFLEWDSVEYAGPDRYLGRPAHRYRLAAEKGAPVITVTLDETYAAVLKLEIRNVSGELLKSMRVTGFKQFDGQWMFSGLAWENRSSRESVRLEVDRFQLP